MDKKVFLENLMEYSKENMYEENVRFFKKSIKFRKVNHYTPWCVLPAE